MCVVYNTLQFDIITINFLKMNKTKTYSPFGELNDQPCTKTIRIRFQMDLHTVQMEINVLKFESLSSGRFSGMVDILILFGASFLC